MEENTYYTLFYCTLHDDGFIIRGLHKYVPDNYDMKHSKKCESCDWYQMGVILYDGYFIKVIEQVRINYDRYGGGFRFIGYSGTVTDEIGNYLDIDENSVLNKWIENIENIENNKIIFLE